ncbi:uncharacterized protein N7473_004963 [Penicillium subrubescens]|uniref:uncharacterized protein n=1 Tax=Penicillium subrubescens TaxID=1316194 RepID=UPI0025456842|nr:uncharacterized protein N7473_004963 [Penicillium subrubescens]KAJ5900893.1 hypothetical protein N7473_004963 [Penicillium subrubescens]
MALPDSGSMQSVSEDPSDSSKPTIIWTELRVPIGHESDKQRWVEYFQPLVHATGHKQSIWARLHFNPERIFREQLASDGITFLIYYEFPGYSQLWFHLLPRRFIYIFWVYFKVLVSEEQKQRVVKRGGIRPPAVLQPRLPVQLWATRTEYLHSEEVQLLLWLHIWRDEEAASWRLIKSRHINSLGETQVDSFHGFLRDIGSMEFKEDYCHFEDLLRL